MKWLTNGDYVIFPPVHLSDGGSYSRTLIDNKKFLLFTSLYGRSFCFNIPFSGSFYYTNGQLYIKSEYGQFLFFIPSDVIDILYEESDPPFKYEGRLTYLKAGQWIEFNENELKFSFSFTNQNLGYFPGTNIDFYVIKIFKISDEFNIETASNYEKFLNYVEDLDNLPFWDFPLYPSYWNEGNINIGLDSSDLGKVVGEHFKVTDSELPTVKFYHGYSFIDDLWFYYQVFYNNETPPIISEKNKELIPYAENYQFLLYEGTYTWSTDPQKQEDIYNEGDAVDYYPVPNEFLGYLEVDGKKYGIVPYARKKDTQVPDWCFAVGKDYNDHSCHLKPIYNCYFNRFTGEVYSPRGFNRRCIEFFEHLPMSFSNIFWLWWDPETGIEREYLYPKGLFLNERIDPDEFRFVKIYFYATYRFSIGFDSTSRTSSNSWRPYERDLNYESNRDKIKNNIPYCYFSDEEPPAIPFVSDSDILGILIALNGYTNMTGCLDYTFNKMFTNNTQGTSPNRYNVFF